MQGTLSCFLSVSECGSEPGSEIGSLRASTFEGFEFDSFVRLLYCRLLSALTLNRTKPTRSDDTGPGAS